VSALPVIMPCADVIDRNTKETPAHYCPVERTLSALDAHHLFADFVLLAATSSTRQRLKSVIRTWTQAKLTSAMMLLPI